MGGMLGRRLALTALLLLLSSDRPALGNPGRPARISPAEQTFIRDHWRRPIPPQGAAPARFSPLELTITVAGRDYRPVEILPLSTGFGEQRLQPRETQTALYLFDDALDINQPLVVSLGSDRNESWNTKLKTIEQERVLIRSRARAAVARP